MLEDDLRIPELVRRWKDLEHLEMEIVGIFAPPILSSSRSCNPSFAIPISLPKPLSFATSSLPRLHSPPSRNPGPFRAQVSVSAAQKTKDRFPADLIVTETKGPHSTIKISVEVPPAISQECYGEVLDEFSKKAKVPGFRQGKKVPENILLNYIGRQNIQQAVVEATLKKTLPHAMSSVREHNISLPTLPIPRSGNGHGLSEMWPARIPCLISRRLRNEWAGIFSDVAVDVTIYVDGQSFLLHKFPLVSRSGKIWKMVVESREPDLSRLELHEVPGGAEAFELAAKFCYGTNFEIMASNVAQLRCIAEYLEMTEQYQERNLIVRAEAFLNEVVFQSLEKSLEVLSSSNDLSPIVDEVGIVNRCIDAIVINASKEQLVSGLAHLECDSRSGKLMMHCQDWFVDKSVHMFDQRNLTSGGVGAPVHKLDGHKWFLDKASIFRRVAEDGFLNIWDYEGEKEKRTHTNWDEFSSDIACTFTNLKYSRVEIDEVRFEWAECMLDYI
ncbi:hypothetical protein ZIOFF_025336 [Zingiber officinale]|uniref:peptidylprolyl isomerase n=1 Tax=Zingiber officinale TaxID=94328 RepID=A0A8J5GVR7_ZINOF|nr:hypothetical protein ZIOFF_025336 [Zingiber officinale]